MASAALRLRLLGEAAGGGLPDSVSSRFSQTVRGLKDGTASTRPPCLQINSPPVFFCISFCNFYGNSLRHRSFFVTPMRSSGSRVDIAQKPNKSGQILDQRWKIFCVIFTRLIPRRMFFCIANILVLMATIGYKNYYIADSKKLKSCNDTRLHYSTESPHSTERTIAKISSDH